jgi:preprotein translocase subunit SecE
VAKKSAAKKQSKRQTRKQPTKQKRGIGKFINETRGELRKVSWPTRREATNLTVIVIFIMVIMAILLGGLDFVFFRLLELLYSLA